MDNKDVFLIMNGVSIYYGWVSTEKDIQMVVNYKNEDFDVIYNKINKKTRVHGDLSQNDKDHIKNTFREGRLYNQVSHPYKIIVKNKNVM